MKFVAAEKLSGARFRRQLAGAAALLSMLAFAGRLPAQQCAAVVRDLSVHSGLSRLRELTRPTMAGSDVAADGAYCTRDTAFVGGRRWRVLGRPVHGAIQRPAFRATVLGGLPDPRGAGSMWSGRGATLWTRAGVSFDVDSIHVLFAPSFWWAQNRRFAFMAWPDSTRSGFASPFYGGEYSIDTPTRFGADPFGVFEPGETALWVSINGWDAGISTSAQAWGPGLRTHLLLGPDAPGIPRVFLRTSPRRTALGDLSAEAFVGTLVESRFFDFSATNDSRRIIAWTAALTPRGARSVSVGLAHGIALEHLSGEGSGEQILSAFLRTRSPDDAFRAWVELGRAGGLPSMRHFLSIPYQGIAYVVGLETPLLRSPHAVLLLSFEAANLEQPTDIREQPPRDFYTSSGLPQGWTHRGRLLGASTGPGSQSQWLSLDWVRASWSLGVYAERVRWNEDAFLRLGFPAANRHDVTLAGGLRAAATFRKYELALRVGDGRRLNYLFQNGTYIPGYRTVDVAVPQFRFTLTPVQ